MPDTTLIDVLTGARNTWGAASALAAVVPLDRVYAFGVPENVEYPNCVVEPGDVSAFFGGTEYYSGGKYQKTNKISFTVTALANTVNWSQLAQDVSDAFGWTSASPRASWVIPNALSVISSMPEVDEFKRTGERIDGVELLAYKSQYSVKIEADRG